MKTETNQPLPNPPIIEAVVDIDCDLPPALDLQTLQTVVAEALQGEYPKFRQQLIQEHVINHNPDTAPELRIHQGLGAMQFLVDDEKQLVQFRPNGFSFNRLAPYTSLDDYLPMIQRGWESFLHFTHPAVVRKIGIRMINRFHLPLHNPPLNLSEYFRVSPQLPATQPGLTFIGFLDQHLAVDPVTGNHANIIKTTEPAQGNQLPILLDVEVFRPCDIAPPDWASILETLHSLRSLKNQIFWNTLTPQCLNLFSQPA